MFQPKGDKARWVTIYEHLQTLNIGGVVKDAELFALLPDASEACVRSAFARAVEEMQSAHHRSFDRVRLVGYRMVEAREHERLARRQHSRATKRLKSAVSKVRSADRSLLTQDERHRIDALEVHLASQQAMLARLDKNLQTETRERKTETAELAERVDQLTALLARHGIGAEVASS